MPIIATANEGKNFTPAPEGVHQAVCVDVIDLGLLKSSFLDDKGNPKFQHKINIVWQINETRDDGKRYQVYKRYTLSLNEKATLRKDLESWRGRAFTRDEELGFDVETVKGVNCLLNVQHHTKGDKTYANAVSVMPLMKGMPKIHALDYERVEPPKAATEPANDAHDDQPEQVEPLTDDDIPF